MKPNSRETLDTYYADAASWNLDRVQSMRSSNRILWWIAGGAAVIAILEAVALVMLMPLKRVEPYTLMVDRTTGYVQALRPLERATISPDAALTQSFLVQYVIAREAFDMATVNTDYRKVALFSADAARDSYLKQMQVSNPASPLILYPRNTIIDARVKSVSPLGPNSALVRFETVRTDANGQSRPLGSWVAVVRYRYSNSAMSVDDRYLNPLGFQVVSYRKDPEALPTLNADATIPPASQPSSAGEQTVAAPLTPAASTTPLATGATR